LLARAPRTRVYRECEYFIGPKGDKPMLSMLRRK
jgi:hypothetical protein